MSAEDERLIAIVRRCLTRTSLTRVACSIDLSLTTLLLKMLFTGLEISRSILSGAGRHLALSGTSEVHSVKSSAKQKVSELGQLARRYMFLARQLRRSAEAEDRRTLTAQ